VLRIISIIWSPGILANLNLLLLFLGLRPKVRSAVALGCLRQELFRLLVELLVLLDLLVHPLLLEIVSGDD